VIVEGTSTLIFIDIFNLFMQKFYALLVAACLFTTTNINAQQFWKSINDATVAPSTKTARTVYPTTYATFNLQTAAFKQHLHAAPQRVLSIANQSGLVVQLPNPQGAFEDYELVRGQIMAPELAAKYPEIETYMGRSISNPANLIRLESTPNGITAMIFAEDGKTYLIDPYSNMTTSEYMVYLKSAYPANANNSFSCLLDEQSKAVASINENRTTAGTCGTLRTYRTAIAASGEYTAFHGGTVSLALAAIVTSVNRLNSIFEREFSVRLNLVANNDMVIYTSAATDPYNGSAGSDINTNNTNLNTVIGSANYDFGHLYGASSLSGLAGLGVVCTASKGRGVTGVAAPIGDPFVVDYVAHEMGHQMNANHTQYNACNNNTATAMEPGSASSIMGYAGICAPNVQNNSNDYFHAISLQEITGFMHSGAGNTCPVSTSTGNVAPSFSVTQPNQTIPKGTPFFLSMAATDANADMLTYTWDQMDGGSGQTMPPTGNNTSGPVFRSLSPTASGTRFFPPLANVVSGSSPTWEVLPQVGRTLNFRGTVRDNRTGGGCTTDNNATITVSNTAGPFVVTNPNAAITLTAGNYELVTWDVAGTDAAPINCSTVNITLSTNGGLLYPITLASNVPNTGSALILVPNNPGLSNRIRVQASNNIFYDISNSDFAIQAPTAPDYQIYSAATSVTACSNATAVYTVNLNSILSFTGPVTLSTTGLPMGVVATFGANPVNAGGSTTLSLSNLSGVTPGSYNFTVNGSGTPGNRSANFNLVVAASTLGSTSLTSPANNATGVNTSTTLQWAAVAGANYDLQVASDAGFNTIVINQTNLTTNSFAITTGLNSGSSYWWRVRPKSSCTTGSYTSAFSFATGTTTCKNFVSTDVPKTIGITANSIANSTVTPSGTASITDVDVLNINITHTWISDLTVRLIHPDNTSAYLIDAEDMCTSEENMNINFDQESSNLYSSITCPLTSGGTFKPKESLTPFYGKPGAGTWTLEVRDWYSGDGGTLNSWTLRLCYVSGTLPVNYRSFTASANNNHIALNWITANELNNKGYYLQRSIDGVNYTNITIVNGKGNSGTDNSYYHYDYTAQPNVLYYYRLQQVDLDGRISYSSTAQAIISKKEGGIKIYPNPASTTLQLFGNSTYKNASIQILNSKGQLMQSSTLVNTNTVLNIASLPSGVYLLKVVKDGITETQKFIKQ